MRHLRHRHLHPATYAVAVWIAALQAAPAAAQQASTVVSPQARARLEGSASTFYPLGRAKGRFQQLFADLGPGRLIQGHAYRRDALTSRGQIAAFRSEMMIALSPAALSPAQPSKTFQQNHGPNPTTVLPRTTVAFPQTDKPTGLTPAPFLLRVPYKTSYGWTGKGTLCMDIVLHGNQTASGQDKNFSADLDAHELFTSGRNLQPGVPFGQGCARRNSSVPAKASFLVRHLGKTADVQIEVRNGVPGTTTTSAGSVLVLGQKQLSQAWPPGTGCTLYTDPAVLVFLSGSNDPKGGWSGTLPVGPPAPAYASMFGQIASLDRQSGELVLTNAAQLTMPPAGPGLVAVRIAHGTNAASATGTISHAVPVTLFF
ncbi:MAG: hypothetical protein ACYTGW_18365 [Planctomycetota bacterium]|jgi:hypothetical protein